MTDRDNEKRGVLYPNDRKRDGKKDPDFTGNVTIGGKTYWLSAWKEESKNGNRYLSLKIGDEKGAKKDGGGYRDKRREEPPADDIGF